MKLCLVTHHKAGTHWSKYVLANYVSLVLTVGRSARIDFDEMEKNYFPIRIDSFFSNSEAAPSHPLAESLKASIDIDAIYWAHFDPVQKARFLDFDKVIFQCRNPMDFLISKFHYDFKRLNSKAASLNLPAILSPFDLHPKATGSWCQIFATMIEMTNAHPSRFEIVSYEQLKSNPDVFFARMIKHLFGTVNVEYLREAIDRSTIENSRQDEIKRNKPIVGHTYSVKNDNFAAGSFVRSGAVGQFNESFDLQQQKVIKDFVSNNITEDALLIFNKLFPVIGC